MSIDPLDRQAGYTLVEMLVVVGVLGLLVAVTHNAIQAGSKLWFQAQSRTASLSDTSSALDVMRRMLAGAIPVFASDDLADRTIAFDGTANRLTLVTNLPDAIAGGVLANQRLFVDAAGDSGSLVLGWQLRQPNAVTGEALAERQTPLLRGIRAIRFAYFGAPDERSEPKWLDRWQGQAKLPILVRMRLEPVGSGGPAWPDLIVEPLATTSPSCAYDVSSVSCRRLP